MNNNREHIALNAYLNLLERNGICKSLIRQRELVILKLVPYLEEIQSDGFSFRNAVDELFKQLDKSQWSTSLPVIRDYFSFWNNDIKAIVAMNQDHAFGVNPTEWKPIDADLKQIWNSLDEITLTISESQPLESYERALRKNGADDFFVVACKKLVKLLLLLLRSAPHKQPVAYRKALDANLTLFSSAEAYKVSLKVGREFYYFWKGDSRAPSLMQPALALAA
ncbi:hypothetical protein [Methylotenera sp.]|uniref:hypothetical protein n=1 Tax=Methylotenera sp. TaxID=2051956 RepID=UPI00271D34CE|nr:hypothetical protein [Methylotenera sp.]MDO9206015.1 hypothetical protein [Methylotenera sp.]MDO9394478.1 hypothetical protein [Methylotenera sp.]MDP1522674.1 hypothetical protein [Methylotenera sp.]MDP2071891.1 hypothetical protein [Methylotenera sp.]MDP2230770.1 hypothetical protein [Methylotenera sp.]